MEISHPCRRKAFAYSILKLVLSTIAVCARDEKIRHDTTRQEQSHVPFIVKRSGLAILMRYQSVFAFMKKAFHMGSSNATVALMEQNFFLSLALAKSTRMSSSMFENPADRACVIDSSRN